MKKERVSSYKSNSKGGHFPIVAIGASAGGLEAVTELLKNLSPATGMAYVYIQHLDPTHKSMLTTLLSKVTKMKVMEAKDKLYLKPNHFYIIPPNKEMYIFDGVLKLQSRPVKPFISMSVDQFFLSLAEKHRQGTIGIILSGNASDGALGLKAIKIAGGLTFAQDKTAKFPGMPKAAISEGVVDFILSPSEMGKELGRLSKQKNLIKAIADEGISDKDHDADAGITDTEFVNILQLLKKSTGVDFQHYKKTTIRRRIIRRMVLHKLNTLKEYTHYLRQHTAEINLLYRDLLINVTTFFRDPDLLAYLKKNILPKIIKQKSINDPIRIWIPACSTGEEAYSIAIILVELLGEKAVNTAIQIFATDLSESAIAKARTGIYTKSELENVSPKRLQNFFTKIDGNYRVIKTLRDLCVFAPHDIFKDPPFSRIDIISCCNLLIYLENNLQKKLLAAFHYSLNKNGYLLLGKSETTGPYQQLFNQVDKKYKIYTRKKDAVSNNTIETNYSWPEYEKPVPSKAKKISQKPVTYAGDIDKTIDSILLTTYVPASVIVDRDLNILQFRGSTGLFLEPAPGKASLNLLKMAKPGLIFELRNAVHKSFKSGHRVRKAGLEIRHKGVVHHIAFEVYPFRESDDLLYLITFEEIPVTILPEAISPKTRDKRLKQLEQELNASREDMRSILEEQEAVNEELQSANEEIVSSNEELQSINEELETSKEEVESTNEELMTINTELQTRNEQLAEANEYTETIFENIGESVIVLDKELRVKKANKSFYINFKVNENDTEGKLIYELGNGQWNISRLRELLTGIIHGSHELQKFVVEHSFPGIGKKIMALSARKIKKFDNQEHILLAIDDITEHIEVKKMVEEREAWFHDIADDVPVLIWAAGPDKMRNFFNKTWLEFTGRPIEKELGMGWVQDLYKDDVERFVSEYNAGFDEQKPFKIEYRLKRHDGEYRWIMSNGKPTYSTDGTFTGFLGTCTEIHDQRLLNEELEKKVELRTRALQKANDNLERSNGELQQFAYVASHDLQEPLRKILTFSDRLIQNYDSKLPVPAKEYVDKITDSSKRMKFLIDDLLNFSRIDISADGFKKVDLNEVAEDTLKDFELENVKMTIGKLPVIDAVPIQMKQLFHNLISNALKFCKEGRRQEINITSAPVSEKEIESYPKLDKNRAYIKLSFSDNGIGFNQKFADKIFIIFQRLNEKSKFQGTGIGLALCRKIANNHNGEIFAESKVNKGATFRVILPVSQKK